MRFSNIFREIFAPKRHQASFLKHVPSQYVNLSAAKNLDDAIKYAKELEVIEEHHSPRQYSDWFSTVINLAHSTGKQALEANIVKTLAEEVTPVFDNASNVVSFVSRSYRDLVFPNVFLNVEKGNVKWNSFVHDHYEKALQMMPEQRDASVMDGAYAAQVRYKGGLSSVPVVIPADNLQSFDNISRIGRLIDIIDWYHNRFADAEKTGRFF
jgi:hypothetical protein